MSYKVLVLDIDGTLMNSEKKITEKTKVALRAAQEAGVTIVLASGRPTPGIVPIAKEIGLDEYGGYILSFNGAIVTNLKRVKSFLKQFYLMIKFKSYMMRLKPMVSLSFLTKIVGLLRKLRMISM